jgi:hypothetical protein
MAHFAPLCVRPCHRIVSGAPGNSNLNLAPSGILGATLL